MPADPSYLDYLGGSSPEISEEPVANPPASEYKNPLSAFIRAFVSAMPERFAGSTIAGVHEWVPGTVGDMAQTIGERIATLPSEALRQEVAETSNIPWFEDDGDPWYDPRSWTPSRLPSIASKATSMFGENLPMMLQSMFGSWLGKKVIGGVAGVVGGMAVPEPTPAAEIAGGLAGLVFSDLVVPSTLIGLQESRNFAKQAAEYGIDPDIAARNARWYGPISGMIEVGQQWTNLGLLKGKSSSVDSNWKKKGFEYILGRLIKKVGNGIPEAVVEGGEEVSQGAISSKLMQKSVREMQERYGPGWQPKTPVEGYSFANAAEDFAAGALIAGMMKGIGFAHNAVLNRVDGDGQSKIIEELDFMNKNQALMLKDTAVSHIQSLDELLEASKGKNRGVEYWEEKNNQRRARIEKNETNIRNIVSAYRSGDTDEALRLYSQQVGVHIMENGTTADQIFAWAQNFEKQGGKLKTMQDPSTKDFYVEADTSLITSPDVSKELFPHARLTVDFADREKWQRPADPQMILTDDEIAMQAQGVSYRLDEKGKVQAPTAAWVAVEKLREDIRIASAEAPDAIGKRGKAEFVQSWIGSMMLTEKEANDLGYGSEFAAIPTKDKVLVKLSDDTTTYKAKFRFGGSNYRDKANGKQKYILFPASSRHMRFEEFVEMAQKPADDGSLTPEETKFYTDFSQQRRDWIDRVWKRISKVAQNVKTERRDAVKISDRLERKRVLITQLNEAVSAFDTTGQVFGKTSKNAKQEVVAMRDMITDMAEADLTEEKTATLQRKLRSIQQELSLLSEGDKLKALADWVGKARTHTKDAIELLSKARVYLRAGFMADVSSKDKEMIQYLGFTEQETKDFDALFLKAQGKALFDHIHSGKAVASRQIRGEILEQRLRDMKFDLSMPELIETPMEKASREESERTNKIIEELAKNTKAISDMVAIQRLEILRQQVDQGVITKEEFRKAVQTVIDQLQPASPGGPIGDSAATSGPPSPKVNPPSPTPAAGPAPSQEQEALRIAVRDNFSKESRTVLVKLGLWPKELRYMEEIPVGTDRMNEISEDVRKTKLAVVDRAIALGVPVGGQAAEEAVWERSKADPAYASFWKEYQDLEVLKKQGKGEIGPRPASMGGLQASPEYLAAWKRLSEAGEKARMQATEWPTSSAPKEAVKSPQESPPVHPESKIPTPAAAPVLGENGSDNWSVSIEDMRKNVVEEVRPDPDSEQEFKNDASETLQAEALSDHLEARSDLGENAYSFMADASHRFRMMNQRFSTMTGALKAFFGGDRDSAELALIRLCDDAGEFAKMTDTSVSPEQFNAWAHSTNGDFDLLALKRSISFLLDSTEEDIKKDHAYFRSVYEQFRIYTPVAMEFYQGISSPAGVLNGKNRRISNRYNRAGVWRERVLHNVRALAANKSMRDEVRTLFDNRTKSRAGLVDFVSAITGIDVSVIDSSSDSFLSGIKAAFGANWIQPYLGPLRSDTTDEAAWLELLNRAFLESPNENVPSNLMHLVNESRDARGYALHGRNHAGDLTISAMIEGPFRQAVLKLAAEQKAKPHEMVRIVSGVTTADGRELEWELLAQETREAIELDLYNNGGNERYGFIRVVPFGDKTQAYFLRVEKRSTQEFKDQYTKLWQEKNSKVWVHPDKILQLSRESAKRAEDFGGDYPSLAQNLDFAHAVHGMAMWKMFYSDASKYAKMIEVDGKKHVDLDSLADAMVKRGSQFPTGGPSYPGSAKVLFVRSLGPWKAKLFDGMMVHSDAFAKEFEKFMGSEFNSTILKPYFRDMEKDLGIKCSSTRISDLKDIPDPILKQLMKIFAENPEITHICDANSVKFYDSTKTKPVDLYTEDGKLIENVDVKPGIISITPRSMFIVQDLNKSTEAITDLMSRQMIFATMHLPNAIARHKLGLEILDIVTKEIEDKNPLNDSAALFEMLRGKRNANLRKALFDNKESADSILHNGQIMSSLFNFIRDAMEPKTLRHAAHQVAAGQAKIPEYEAGKGSAAGWNHMPWSLANVSMRPRRLRDGSTVTPMVRRPEVVKDKKSALEKIRANPRQHADLFKLDSVGTPIFAATRDAEDLERYLIPTFLREVDGKLHIVGSYDWLARIPSDALYSAAPTRHMGPVSEGSEAGLAAISEGGRKDNGSDMDGDALFGSILFMDAYGNPIVDNSLVGIMNRRLLLLARDYEQADLQSVTTAGTSFDLEELKGSMIDIAKKVGEHKLKEFRKKFYDNEKASLPYPPINTRAFNEHMLGVYYTGKKILGACAKNNGGTTLEMLHGAYFPHDLHMGGMTISLDQERASKLMDSFQDRMNELMIVGRTMINWSVDDTKNPSMHFVLDYDSIGMVLTAMRGMQLTPQNYKEKLYQFLLWFNTSKEALYFRKEIARIRAGAQQIDVMKGLIESDNRDIRALAALYGIAQARRTVGRFGDSIVVANAPQTIYEFLQKKFSFERITGGKAMYYLTEGKYGPYTSWRANKKDSNPIPIYYPGNLSGPLIESGQRWIDTMDKFTSESTSKQTTEWLKEVIGKAYLTEKQISSLYRRLLSSLAVRAVWKGKGDPNTFAARFASIKKEYEANPAARGFLDLLVPEKGSIKILFDYRTIEMQEDRLKLAHAGWNALSPEHQSEFAMYLFARYGTGDSAWGGSYIALLSPEYRKEIDPALAAPQFTEDVNDWMTAGVPKQEDQSEDDPRDMTERPAKMNLLFVPKVATAPVSEKVPSVKSTQPAPTISSGFRGYRGGFSNAGKGTAKGDGKDQAMRQVANAFVGELSSRRASSTLTSAIEIGKKSDFTPVISEKMFTNAQGDSGVHYVRVTPQKIAQDPEIVVMLARNKEFNGQPLSSETVSIITALATNKQINDGKPVRFVVGDMPGVDSQFVELLERLGASFEIYHAGNISRIQAREVKKPVAQSVPSPSGNISSNAKGLLAALTNPTELARKKGNLDRSYPVEFRGKTYPDSEAAYKANISIRGPTPENRALMTDIIEAKLRQHPDLMSQIPVQSEWWDGLTHNVTGGPWEGGKDSPFILALAEAWQRVSESSSPAPVVPSPKPSSTKLTGFDQLPSDLTAQMEAVADLIPRSMELAKDLETFQMELIPDLSSTLKELDNGKFGVQAAFVKAYEEMTAEETAAAMKVRDWRKMVGEKESLWELITRFIDDPDKYKNTPKHPRLQQSDFETGSNVETVNEAERENIRNTTSLTALEGKLKHKRGKINDELASGMPDDHKLFAMLQEERWIKTQMHKVAKAIEAQKLIDGDLFADLNPAMVQALKDNKNLKQVILEIRAEYEAIRLKLNEQLEGLSPDEFLRLRDHYINRVWRRPAGSKDGKPAMSTGHVNSRYYPTISDGERAGLELLVKDAGELYMRYVREATWAASKRLMFAETFLVRNASGESMVIPEFEGASIPPPRTLAAEHAAVNQMSANLAANFDEEHKHEPLWDRLIAKAKMLTAKTKPESEDYIRVESPFREYSYFWVHPEAADIMKSMTDDKWEGDFIKKIERVNAWSKWMTLGLSAFHPIAIWENVVATLYPTNSFKMSRGRLRFAWNADPEFQKKLKDPAFVKAWIKSGLGTAPAPNIDMGVIAKDLDSMAAWAKDRHLRSVGFAVGAMQKYKKFVDKHLWQNLNSQSKLYAAEFFLQKRMEQLDREGKPYNEDLLRQEIAQAVNKAFGDLAWHRMIWATPKVRQLFRLLLFAPDWTLSNIEIARAGLAAIPGVGKVFDKGISQEDMRLAAMRVWPGMLVFMLGWPNVLQALIYAAFGGSPDDDDKIFAVENEKGKMFTVDTTPFFRFMGWTNKDNPKERLYMRFAKQSWEVLEAIENPLQTAKGKSSALVKIAYEQVSGENMIGRDAPWKSEPFWTGILTSDEKGFMGSRAGTVVEKFIPMTVLQYFKGEPPSWIAPTSKGMTRNKAQFEMAKVIAAYADPSTWAKITGTPDYERKLDNLVVDIVDAAERNGVNTKQTLKDAKSQVVGKYYEMFWRALNRQDGSEMERAAGAVVRMNAAIRGFHQSMEGKYKKINRPYTAQDRSLVRQFVEEAQRKITPREEHDAFMQSLDELR